MSAIQSTLRLIILLAVVVLSFGCGNAQAAPTATEVNLLPTVTSTALYVPFVVISTPAVVPPTEEPLLTQARICQDKISSGVTSMSTDCQGTQLPSLAAEGQSNLVFGFTLAESNENIMLTMKRTNGVQYIYNLSLGTEADYLGLYYDGQIKAIRMVNGQMSAFSLDQDYNGWHIVQNNEVVTVVKGQTTIQFGYDQGFSIQIETVRNPADGGLMGYMMNHDALPPEVGTYVVNVDNN